MDYPWLRHYPAGVPHEIDPGLYPSLLTLIEESLAGYADKTAYHFMGTDYRYSDVDTLSGRLAAHFARIGLQAGERVALMLPNSPHYPVSAIAALRAGLVIVNVNPLYTAPELSAQLADAAPSAIVLADGCLAALDKCPAQHRPAHVLVCDPTADLIGPGALMGRSAADKQRAGHPCLESVLAAPSELPSPVLAVRPEPESLAVLQYTGGTTGVSKGAMLTHRNIIANILQFQAWNGPVMARIPAGEQHTSICALPMYHIFAFTVVLMLSLRLGGRVIIIPNARDIGETLRLMQPHRFHELPGVNTLYNALLNHPDFTKVDWSHLKLCVAGGAPMQETVAKRWEHATGCPIREGYGLTETSPAAAANPAEHVQYNGTIGIPLPSTVIRIADDAGQAVPNGSEGEIIIKGPQVMKGYWRRPEETAQVMTADGFLRTGDVGVMDEDGYIRVVDRKKDVILVSGFNVYPNEVEQAAMAVPGVLECAAVGIPSSSSGEAVKLFVVRKDPALTQEALITGCADRLTGYKMPRAIEFVETLPKSAVGKILRRELKKQTEAR